MSEPRWSTGDPREDHERDQADEAAAARLIYEAGGDQAAHQWCPRLRRMRLRTEPTCGTCIGAGPFAFCARNHL